MTRYKLKELRNTKQYEDRIHYYVKQHIGKKKKVNYLIPLFTAIVSIALVVFVISQINTPAPRNVTATSQKLLHVFEEVKGDGVAYSEFFHGEDQQHIRTLKYYKPVQLPVFTKANNISFSQVPAPFTVQKGEVIAVNDGMNTELQFHFENNDAFLNISMVEFYYNPINDEAMENVKVDTAGNALTDVKLDADNPLYHQKLTTSGGLVFKYYHYDVEKNLLHLMVDTANEFYTYYNGIIYHIGYTGNVDEQEMIAFARDFILNNEVQTLQLQQMTMEDNWWVNGGKSMVIAVSLLIIIIGATYFVVRTMPKKSKWIIKGFILVFFIAPLLSWIISMTIGMYDGEGFTAVGMLVITFPILEMISISVLIRGIMMKKQQ